MIYKYKSKVKYKIKYLIKKNFVFKIMTYYIFIHN